MERPAVRDATLGTPIAFVGPKGEPTNCGGARMPHITNLACRATLPWSDSEGNQRARPSQ